MKTCTGCKKDKCLSEFHRNSKAKDGHMWVCKECNSSKSKAWKMANLDVEKARAKKWYQDNKASKNAKSKQWVKDNLEKVVNTIGRSKKSIMQITKTNSWLHNIVVRRNALKVIHYSNLEIN